MTTFKDQGQRHMMPLGGDWYVWTDKEMKDWENGTENQQRRAVILQREYPKYLRNRLAYFLPHCDGKDFINDRDTDICLLTKGNQNGGTVHGVAWVLFRTLKCDATWETFTQHGIRFHPYRGPLRVLIATWSWENMAQAVWPEYLKFLPREELGEYAPYYGDEDLYPEEAERKGKQKYLTFPNTSKKPFVTKISKIEFYLRVYSQPQPAFETTQFDIVHLDEQCPEPKFDGVDERGRTRPVFQVAMTMTGHKLPGFKDTGKAGWVYRKLYLDTDHKGHSVKKYKLWVSGVPDAIYSEESKKKAYQKHVEIPRQNRDKRALRVGMARYFGEWEGESETVIDNYDATIHMIPPFQIPYAFWPLYRGMDHGRTRPMAAVWGAMTPQGCLIIYREYYEIGKTIPQNAQGIIERSGNMRQKISELVENEFAVSVYEEIPHREEYMASVMDARSFGRNLDDVSMTIGTLYNNCGCSCTAASARHDNHLIPMLQSWFEVDYTRDHIMVWLHANKLVSDADYANWLEMRGKDTKGFSRVAIFNDCRMLQTELETWQNKVGPNGEETDKAEDKNNHCIDSLKYIIGESPEWYEKHPSVLEEEEQCGIAASSVTGY